MLAFTQYWVDIVFAVAVTIAVVAYLITVDMKENRERAKWSPERYKVMALQRVIYKHNNQEVK